MGELNLLEVVDADRVLMSLARERHLDEVGGDTQLHEFPRVVLGVESQGDERLIGRLSPGDVETIENASRHRAAWKPIERPSNVAARVTSLKAADQNEIQRRTGYDTQ